MGTVNPADLQELDTIDEDGRAWIATRLATLVEIGHDAAALWESEVLARALHPAGTNRNERRTSCGTETWATPSSPVSSWRRFSLAGSLASTPSPDRRSVPQPSAEPVTACQIASGSRTGVAPSVRRDRCLTAATVAVLAPLIPLLARGGWT